MRLRLHRASIGQAAERKLGRGRLASLLFMLGVDFVIARRAIELVVRHACREPVVHVQRGAERNTEVDIESIPGMPEMAGHEG